MNLAQGPNGIDEESDKVGSNLERRQFHRHNLVVHRCTADLLGRLLEIRGARDVSSAAFNPSSILPYRCMDAALCMTAKSAGNVGVGS